MRRRNLLLTALGIGSLLIPVVALLRDWRVTLAMRLAEPQALSALLDAAVIGDIGQSYRLQTPSEDSAEVLSKLIYESCADVEKSNTCVAPSTSIEKRIADEFRTGKIIIVKGWSLAVTEARQCGLLSLLNS